MAGTYDIKQMPYYERFKVRKQMKDNILDTANQAGTAIVQLRKKMQNDDYVTSVLAELGKKYKTGFNIPPDIDPATLNKMVQQYVYAQDYAAKIKEDNPGITLPAPQLGMNFKDVQSAYDQQQEIFQKQAPERLGKQLANTQTAGPVGGFVDKTGKDMAVNNVPLGTEPMQTMAAQQGVGTEALGKIAPYQQAQGRENAKATTGSLGAIQNIAKNKPEGEPVTSDEAISAVLDYTKGKPIQKPVEEYIKTLSSSLDLAKLRNSIDKTRKSGGLKREDEERNLINQERVLGSQIATQKTLKAQLKDMPNDPALLEQLAQQEINIKNTNKAIKASQTAIDLMHKGMAHNEAMIYGKQQAEKEQQQTEQNQTKVAQTKESNIIQEAIKKFPIDKIDKNGQFTMKNSWSDKTEQEIKDGIGEIYYNRYGKNPDAPTLNGLYDKWLNFLSAYIGKLETYLKSNPTDTAIQDALAQAKKQFENRSK